MFAIYHDPLEFKPFALCRYDPASPAPRGAEIHRAFDLGELRQYVAESHERRMECVHEVPHAAFECDPPKPLACLGRDPKDPRSLVEVWARPDR